MNKIIFGIATAIFALLASSLMAMADTAGVTSTVSAYRNIALLTTSADNSAQYNLVAINVDYDDLVATMTEDLDDAPIQGWLHWWSNADFRVKIHRDTGSWPASMKLWMAPDGLGDFEIPIGAGSAHQVVYSPTAATTDTQVPCTWQIRGLSPATPAGSYTTTVTFTLSAY